MRIKLGTKVRVLRCEHQQVAHGTEGVATHDFCSPSVKTKGIGVEIEQVWKDATQRQYKGKETVFVADGDYEEVK